MCEYCDKNQITFGDILYTDEDLNKLLLNDGLWEEDEEYGIPIEFCPCCGRSLLDEYFVENIRKQYAHT